MRASSYQMVEIALQQKKRPKDDEQEFVFGQDDEDEVDQDKKTSKKKKIMDDDEEEALAKVMGQPKRTMTKKKLWPRSWVNNKTPRRMRRWKYSRKPLLRQKLLPKSPR